MSNRNLEQFKYSVRTYAHLMDCYTREQIECASLDEAKERLAEFLKKRVCASIYLNDGGHIKSNYPNPYALSRELSYTADEVWKNGTEKEIQELISKQKY
ncbi:hypothetical protein [Vibrio splendidus]|uniref:hypothetical protein n=1 Tax=Vibrio splendidus TaxID=29497 RepID=UPI003D0C4C3D